MSGPDQNWFVFWFVVLILSRKKSGWRTIAIIAMICLLCGCSPLRYDYSQARAAERHHEHRVAVKQRQTRKTQRAIFDAYLQEQKELLKLKRLKQKQLSQVDAAAHQKSSK